MAPIDNSSDLSGHRMAAVDSSYVQVVDAFPMTVTGKVQKFALRERVAADLGLHAVKTA